MWYRTIFCLLLTILLRSEIVYGSFRLRRETRSILMAEPDCFLLRARRRYRHRQRSSFTIPNHRLAHDHRDHALGLDEKRFGSVLYWLHLPTWQSNSSTLLAMVRLYDHITTDSALAALRSTRPGCFVSVLLSFLSFFLNTAHQPRCQFELSANPPSSTQNVPWSSTRPFSASCYQRRWCSRRRASQSIRNPTSREQDIVLRSNKRHFVSRFPIFVPFLEYIFRYISGTFCCFVHFLYHFCVLGPILSHFCPI